MTNNFDAAHTTLDMPFDRIDVSVKDGQPTISMIYKGRAMAELSPERTLSAGDTFSIAATGTMKASVAT